MPKMSPTLLGFSVMGGLYLTAMTYMVVHEHFFPKPANATIATVEAAQTPNPVNAERAEKCRKALKVLPASVLRNYRFSDGYGTVVVGAGFELTEFENKQLVNEMVLCVFADGRRKPEGVRYVEYVEPLGHKEIARWSDVTGFSVE